MTNRTFVASLQTADPLAPTVVVLDGSLLRADDKVRREHAAAILDRAVRDPSGSIMGTEIPVSPTTPNLALHVAVATSADVEPSDLIDATRLVAETSGVALEDHLIESAIEKLLAGAGTVQRSPSGPSSTMPPPTMMQRIFDRVRQAWAYLFGDWRSS